MRLPLAITAVLSLLATSPVFADPWTVGMEEDEGGPVLTASVMGPVSGEPRAMISITCFDKVNVRYDPAALTDVEVDSTATFAFASKGETVVREFQYEEMDGMFAAYLPGGDPLINLLMSGDEVVIGDEARKLPGRGLTLEGSRAAIGKVLADCGP